MKLSNNPEDDLSQDKARKALYKSAREEMGINKRQWARLFNLGELKGAADVQKKELPTDQPLSRGVNKPEALASALLLFLHKKGYDVESITFDEKGYLANVPRLKKSSNPPQ